MSAPDTTPHETIWWGPFEGTATTRTTDMRQPLIARIRQYIYTLRERAAQRLYPEVFESRDSFRKEYRRLREEQTASNMFIQWKNTVLCVDLFELPCGHNGGHFDGHSAYYVRCPECQKVFEMGSSVSLTPVDGPVSQFVVAHGEVD